MVCKTLLRQARLPSERILDEPATTFHNIKKRAIGDIQPTQLAENRRPKDTGQIADSRA